MEAVAQAVVRGRAEPPRLGQIRRPSGRRGGAARRGRAPSSARDGSPAGPPASRSPRTRRSRASAQTSSSGRRAGPASSTSSARPRTSRGEASSTRRRTRSPGRPPATSATTPPARARPVAAGHDALDDRLDGVARAEVSHGGASAPEGRRGDALRGASTRAAFGPRRGRTRPSRRRGRRRRGTRRESFCSGRRPRRADLTSDASMAARALSDSSNGRSRGSASIFAAAFSLNLLRKSSSPLVPRGRPEPSKSFFSRGRAVRAPAVGASRPLPDEAPPLHLPELLDGVRAVRDRRDLSGLGAGAPLLERLAHGADDVSTGIPLSRQPRMSVQSFGERRKGVPRSAMKASSDLRRVRGLVELRLLHVRRGRRRPTRASRRRPPSRGAGSPRESRPRRRPCACAARPRPSGGPPARAPRPPRKLPGSDPLRARRAPSSSTERTASKGASPSRSAGATPQASSDVASVNFARVQRLARAVHVQAEPDDRPALALVVRARLDEEARRSSSVRRGDRSAT